MRTLTWNEVLGRRLARQHLLAPASDARTAVRGMCGAHAQIPTASELSVGLRLEGATRTDVRAAICDDRTLIRTHGPRGTVHLLPTADLPHWLGALSSVPTASAMPATIRLDHAQTDAIVVAAADAVADADLTLGELDAAIGARCGAWAIEEVMPAFQTLWPRWRQALSAASHRGAVCFGPLRGRTVTYASPTRWFPGVRPADGDASVAWLLRSYLRFYGPARPQDFARWLAAPPSWAAACFAALADELEAVACDDWTGWVVRGDTAPGPEPDGLWLLPYFDAYAVGSYPRERVFPGRAGERALAGTQAGNFPVLLIDGEVAGVWHQKRAGGRIVVTVEPLDSLRALHRRALDDAVERIGMIGQGRPELVVGRVTVGAHA